VLEPFAPVAAIFPGASVAAIYVVSTGVLNIIDLPPAVNV